MSDHIDRYRVPGSRLTCLALVGTLMVSGCGSEPAKPLLSDGSRLCIDWATDGAGLECTETRTTTDVDLLEAYDALGTFIDGAGKGGEGLDDAKKRLQDLFRENGWRPTQADSLGANPFGPRFRPQQIPVDDWAAMRAALAVLRAL